MKIVLIIQNWSPIKDKFLISVVDELLDECHGANYFTKLDLSSCYDKIWMDAQDITVFFTHHKHFGFLIMPFGLTNAPSTSQVLVNEVFHKY